MAYNLLKIPSVVFFIVTFFSFLSESNCFKKLAGRTVDLRKCKLHRPLVLPNTHARGSHEGKNLVGLPNKY